MDNAASRMCGMKGPGRHALDAHTDQALAHLRNIREQGTDPAVAALGAELAELLREQFPGHGVLAGRVLMSAASALTSYGVEIQEACDAPPHPWVLVNLLGFTAEALNTGGGQ